MIPAALLHVFAVMMTSLCEKFYQFLLAQGLLTGLAMGCTMAPSMAATAQYFDKKRGAAIGLAVAGSSLGGVIFPIALSKMLTDAHLSFGWTVRILGFVVLILLIPASLATRARFPPRKSRFFLFRAFTELPYVSLIAAILLAIMGVWIPIFYLPSFAVSRGMRVGLAFHLTAIMNAASFFGRIIPGIAADKLGRRNVLTVFTFATAILAFSWHIPYDNVGIIVFAAFYGFTSGAIISLTTVCLAQVAQNPENIGTYMGQGMLVAALGALTGPPASGKLVAMYGSYTQASMFSGAVTLASGFGLLFVKYVSHKGMLSKS